MKSKAVILHKGNKLSSELLAHAANIKDSNENIKLLFEKIRYEKYNCNDCGDLKIIVALFGLRLSCTKVCCFLCEWNIRDGIHQYIQSVVLTRNAYSKTDKMQ
jgi:hypothetical protein